MNEEDIIKNAIQFANKHKKEVAHRLTDKTIFLPESHPVSIFMAGSPGAGKTESAKEFILQISENRFILRIDSDEVRCEFDTYTGTNSSMFQGATSILVEKIHDYALKQKQSFVFDGTLSNLEKSITNVERSLSKKRDRAVFIIYVYQDPLQAWDFVKKRAIKDGRVVPKTAFVHEYFAARSNVNEIKEKFGSGVQVDLVVKNIDGSNFRYKENITVIDNYIKEKYSEEELNALLKD